jgi:glycosyltransferase involved in cell wall biosynthesis
MCAGYRARNLGLRVSRGDWIYWLSDDDILLSNALETLAGAIRENDSSEIVYGDYLAWEDERYFRKVEELTSQSFPMTGIPALAVRHDLDFARWRSWSWKKSWNRPNDYDLLNRLVRAGVETLYVPRILAVSPPVGSTGLTGSAAHLASESRQLEEGDE